MTNTPAYYDTEINYVQKQFLARAPKTTDVNKPSEINMTDVNFYGYLN